MKRQDDFTERRKHLATLNDEELYRHFWELTAKVVDPLLELGKKNTSPSIERSVLLRMGFSSPDTKAIVEGCIDQELLGKGAGHVVYRLSKLKNISINEAGAMLAAGQGWNDAVALFKA
ncbi:D-ornithine aminomutase S component [Treponema primitia ZAS-2]|uniref:D-ornithine aminomutase S component n=1 Tax=Treponema primitia (strain ATCC BAA-887 / DSM 12427 / ZAS-2) TaxID=545694 RepID=F5YQT0_TREPZ|nr:ornithine aminomutase subunit alpha [Treponema primitia]AEF85919.1 D-ornithine aminomutase S component [Treponema primitia ZAS-2]